MAAMEVLQIKIYKFYGKKEIKKLMMNKKENIHMFWNNWILDRKKVLKDKEQILHHEKCWSYAMFKGPSANMEER